MNKSEREKMLAGEGYLAFDRELGEMNTKAQEIFHIFNFSHPNVEIGVG